MTQSSKRKVRLLYASLSLSKKWVTITEPFFILLFLKQRSKYLWRNLWHSFTWRQNMNYDEYWLLFGSRTQSKGWNVLMRRQPRYLSLPFSFGVNKLQRLHFFWLLPASQWIVDDIWIKGLPQIHFLGWCSRYYVDEKVTMIVTGSAIYRKLFSSGFVIDCNRWKFYS